MMKKLQIGVILAFIANIFHYKSLLAFDENGKCGISAIDTAIGCIPVLQGNNSDSFMAWALRWATGVGSGIAFLLILYGSFMYMTSQGNPERVKAGQELITSAVSGLILIILSVFLLKFIGVDILGLGSFGFGRPL